MNLRKKALNGLKWTISSAAIQAIIQLLKLGIITRLLSPEDFGLMAIILFILGIGELFKDMGMSAAIIHKQDISTNQLSSLYWLNIILGLVLFFIISLSAFPLSTFFESPDLFFLIPFSASVLFFQSFGQQYSVLFRKELKFNILERISLAIKMVDFVIVISLALLGYGVWSLIYAQILSSITSSSLSFALGRQIHLPSFRFKLNDIKPFFSFGLYQLGGQLLNHLNSNLDKIILGKFFGMEILGFYNLAWQLIQYPKARINPIINKISFPLYSKMQNQKEQLGNYYSFTIRTLSLLIIPIYLFLGFFSSDIVFLILGEGWNLSAQLVQILAGVGIFKMIANPGGSVLLALGRADIEFWWNTFWIILSSIILLYSMSLSPDIYTLAYTLLVLNCFGSLIWHYIIHKVSNVNYSQILLSILKSSTTSCLVLLLVSNIQFLSKMNDFILFKIGIVGFFFSTLYVWSMWIFDKELIKKIIHLISDLLPLKNTQINS